MDNYATHTKAEVPVWLSRNLCIRVHFTPTPAGWMNLVEVWFSIVKRHTCGAPRSAPAAQS